MIIDENGEARHSRYTTTKSIIGIVCCRFQVILGEQFVTHLYPARAIHTKWIFNHKNLPVTGEDEAFIKKAGSERGDGSLEQMDQQS